MTAKKKKKKTVGACPGFLAHAVIGVFYSVIANRHQPNRYPPIYYRDLFCGTAVVGAGLRRYKGFYVVLGGIFDGLG